MKRHILGLVCAALMGSLAACDTPVDEPDRPEAPAAAAAETKEQGVRSSLDPCANTVCAPGQVCQSPLDQPECVTPTQLCGGEECPSGHTCERFGEFEWCLPPSCQTVCPNPTVCYPVCNDPFSRHK
jgi:hypothetical protein